MNLKKTFTMVPGCSLGETFHCNKMCSCCDKATEIKYGIVQAPENIPIPISFSIDKDSLYSGEHTFIRITYDKPIDINIIKVVLGKGLNLVESRYDKDRCNIVVEIIATEEFFGLVNATVSYKGITRLFQVKVALSLPKVIDISLKPDRVRIGEPVLVNIILNRTLRHGEPTPEVILEEDEVSLTQPLSVNALSKEVYNCTITPIIETGYSNIQVKFDDQIIGSAMLTIYEDEELNWASKEDIDALFPELNDDGGVIVPDPDLPPLIVDWATEEDIDALFPELNAKK